MSNGESINGVPVTEEQIAAWASEAEVGYDVDVLKRRGRGRPGRGAEPAQVVALRLTSEELAALDSRAAREHKSRSELIREAIAARLNIVICGGTGSGKTTLANAVIAEIVSEAPQDRMVILEDTAEIRCTAENAVALHTSDAVDMARLLKSTMRLRPDRIIVREVRDGAALTLLKAWNTGHPGGVTTIHSNSTLSALRRLEQLTAEVSQQPMHAVIGEAVTIRGRQCPCPTLDVSVVVEGIGFQNVLKVPLPEDQHMIQALPTKRADQRLDIA